MNKPIPTPARVVDIDKSFVKEFTAAASAKDRKWIMLTLERANAEKGNRGGFSAFRVEFAKKYFPEIFSAKNTKKKPTLLEELREICA
jgi:hypothetical protein